MTKVQEKSKIKHNANLRIGTTQEIILNRYLLSIDQNYKSVIFNVAKVSIYRFEDEWNEMGIEGSLYIYKRNADQEHRLIVFNRRGLNDFKLNIPKYFYLEIENQFAIFSHTDKKNIFGFWFDEGKTAGKFGKVLESLMGEKEEDVY